jgi:23S rRNA (cytosine1962-C5)-methyltransferase
VKPSLAERFRRASARRAPLREDPGTTAFRLVNGEGDGAPDVTVDWFDGVAVLSAYDEPAPGEERERLAAAAEAFSPRAVYLKRRPREARVEATTRKAHVAPDAPAWGSEVPELDVLENGLRFRIRPGQGLSVGLYLDMRDTRALVRSAAQGRTVLNCFAYTCGFGVAAVAGGAERAVNVDLSRRVLDWGEQNARLNGQSPRREDHLSGDVFEWLRRFAKKGQRFDMVILDPPSFATSRGTRFSAAKDYPRLVAAAAPVLGDRALLVACCNLADLEPRRFEGQVRAGLGRPARVVARLGASELDFPRAPERLPALKVLVLEASR